ncbi:peptidylprolyl isomerase [Sphingomicrobium flavum]|uniref:peptidylprolyl isomerase n=1 Tax=Sphingomicrobium flavum TaxID=1229164 RepID=UPI0021AD6DF7|nr:peptidylprolyl isomerase [Sphingomicrobium flavum]
MSFSIFAIAASVALQEAPAVRSPYAVLDEAPESAWTTIPAGELVVMMVGGERVVIQLNTAFAPTHAANVERLARAGYWDGASVYRVVDNFVAQWGFREGEEYNSRPAPDGVVDNPPADFSRPGSAVTIMPHGSPDPFSQLAGYENGWPVALHADGSVSPVYCYGTVGVAREGDPDTGSGDTLFAAIGTPPRRLDRNFAVVGRVIDGIEHLSTLPRGSGAMSVYAEGQSPATIATVRMMDQLPEGEQEKFVMMTEGSASFAEYAYLQRHRLDYGRGTSGADICSVQVPIKKLED